MQVHIQHKLLLCVRVRARVLCVVRCIVLCVLNDVNGPTLFCLIKYLYLARMGQVVTCFLMLFACPAFTVIFFLQNFIFNHTTGAGYSGRAAKSRLFPHSSSCIWSAESDCCYTGSIPGGLHCWSTMNHILRLAGWILKLPTTSKNIVATNLRKWKATWIMFHHNTQYNSLKDIVVRDETLQFVRNFQRNIHHESKQ